MKNMLLLKLNMVSNLKNMHSLICAKFSVQVVSLFRQMFQVIVESCERHSLLMHLCLDHCSQCFLCSFCTPMSDTKDRHLSFLFLGQFAFHMAILSQLAQFHAQLKHLVLQVQNIVLILHSCMQLHSSALLNKRCAIFD